MSESQVAGAASTEAETSAVATPADPGATQTQGAPGNVSNEAPAGELGTSLLGGDGAEQPEAKPEGDATGDEKPADKAAEPVDFTALKLPEGVAQDDPLLASFTEAAAESGMSLDAAQALLDKIQPKIAAQIEAAQVQLYDAAKERISAWERSVREDPEIGGKNLAANMSRIIDTVARFGDVAEVKNALNMTGAGSNPAIVRLLHNMSKALSEGGAVAQGAPPSAPKTVGAVLYDHPTSHAATGV